MIADCMGSLMGFDVLCSMNNNESTFQNSSRNKKYASDTNLNETQDLLESSDACGTST